MIRAVFFDFYGTLAGWRSGGERIQAQAARAEGLRVDEGLLGAGYRAADAYLAEENAVRPVSRRTAAERDAVFAEYERRLLAEAGAQVDAAMAMRVWRRVDAMPKQLAAYDDALPTLTALRALGVTTGVISNMGGGLDAHLEEVGLQAAVDAAVSSGEVGVGKPHALIFRTALTRAGVAAAEALHVGDSYSGDVLGAQGAGMEAVFLDRDGAEYAPVGCEVIQTLRAVVPLVEARGLPGSR